ncbi:prepilin-type N-terminal cleavage/methylation domain-containing protein [Levilactobacillus bambusae]|uniref:Competence protein ComGF n=1 Tax=Levilactobacillus bambusae TaxID=2024736 RepID=A0A2V1MZU0_9LACO|nr:prepilin-type N-terminal cleavage/methylation domain-containing protein [Levilactobacillus bambusae]PWF99609.1 hypothetical protein DCM90_09215 [Levilactobacillus bambusae]
MRLRGFTLVETLFALVLTALVMLTVQMGVTSLKTVDNQHTELNWYETVAELESKRLNLSLLGVKSHALTLMDGRQHNVRSLNIDSHRVLRLESGYEPLMTDVRQITFKQIKKSQLVQVTINLMNGERYQTQLCFQKSLSQTSDKKDS